LYDALFSREIEFENARTDNVSHFLILNNLYNSYLYLSSRVTD